MTRLILTFETVFQVLSAEKVLKDRVDCRTVPTPAGLSSSICAISVELLDISQETDALNALTDKQIIPQGVHKI